MKVIVCLDKSKGMLFNGRRQSQDRILRENLLELVGNGKLFLNAYSAKQFESDEKLTVSEDFLALADETDFCFVETSNVPTDADEYYLFLWNRDYPADRYFEIDLKANGYKKIHSQEFAGSSHKKITLEVYRRL